MTLKGKPCPEDLRFNVLVNVVINVLIYIVIKLVINIFSIVALMLIFYKLHVAAFLLYVFTVSKQVQD